MHLRHPALSLVVAALAVAGLTAAELSPVSQAVLDRISSDSLKGHVSFLASDILEGRATPSKGQDVAAQYIASQFRRAGLEEAGDDGYFQTANFVSLESDAKDATIDLVSGQKRIVGAGENMTLQTTRAIMVEGAEVTKVGLDDSETIARLQHEDLGQRVLAVYLPPGWLFGEEGHRRRENLAAIRKLKAVLLVVAGRTGGGSRRARLVAADELETQPQMVLIRPGQFADVIENAEPGVLPLKLDANIPAPKTSKVVLKNVAGLLRGSDPVLSDTYILLTAHYDHVGTKPEGDDDRIYNGANDDASGVASVIEIAAALATMNPKPRRSILFVALFGEEVGLLGSEFYGRHPLLPLQKTVADINLEQLGRTDSSDGPKIASASFTGFDFSGVPAVFELAGKQTGVTVYKDEKRSDPFFSRSDNQALADLGIPSHTLCVAFEFPDYHGVGDEWQKLDYANMAKVDRMVALGLILLADSETAPAWSEQVKTRKYTDAWHSLHGGTQ
jgi:hypothetical protein